MYPVIPYSKRRALRWAAWRWDNLPEEILNRIYGMAFILRDQARLCAARLIQGTRVRSASFDIMAERLYYGGQGAHHKGAITSDAAAQREALQHRA
jgi:hypothetical protein